MGMHEMEAVARWFPRSAWEPKRRRSASPRWTRSVQSVRSHAERGNENGRAAARRGMTLFELTVALFILTTAMMAIVQLMAATASQRRSADQRRIALQEVANQAERVALL